MILLSVGGNVDYSIRKPSSLGSAIAMRIMEYTLERVRQHLLKSNCFVDTTSLIGILRNHLESTLESPQFPRLDAAERHTSFNNNKNGTAEVFEADALCDAS